MSTVAKLLEQQHGDLHEVIPEMASKHGQEETARRLNVRQAWISRWLRRNGYRLETRYVRDRERMVS